MTPVSEYVADVLNRAVEPPNAKSIEEAILLLMRIGAMDENESLTLLG